MILRFWRHKSIIHQNIGAKIRMLGPKSPNEALNSNIKYKIQIRLIFVTLKTSRSHKKTSSQFVTLPQQIELIWTMPWGCWVELEDKDVHCKEWKYIIENFAEEEAHTTVHQIYGQRATLSVNYKPGDWDSVRAWILKAGSGWHQVITAENSQNMNNFAAGSLGAATAHRIKWILSGRSAGEQMRQWQQALQAEQIIDTGPKRVSPLSAFQIAKTKEGGMMVITTTRITGHELLFDLICFYYWKQ